MRIVPFIISALITTALVWALNTKWGSVPPIGKFLSPQHGFWQNAEPEDKSFDLDLDFPELKGNVDVYFDDRLIPHVFAENDEDAYFVQGFLHAKFRLWQMEFQIFAAAGMVSQVLGEGKDSMFLKYDRSMRRLGMIYSAEKALAEIEKDPLAKSYQDAYVAGVNAYIDNMRECDLPLEYKLLNYKPERWSSLKTALLLKYMSYELAGGEEDMRYTNAMNVFTVGDFEKLFPAIQDSLKPIVPNIPGSEYPAQAAIYISVPETADSLYFLYPSDTVTNILPQPDPDNGSNNWAVAGSKTASGRPIVANDPHLGLNLPSLWYEMQLSSPNFNAYGVTFPGAPNIIIGFNDNIAFGFTNAGRDVKDYYEIRFRDKSMNEYWFDSAWKKTDKREEVINVRGKSPFRDTVAYTIFGPVIYDHNFPATSLGDKYFAVRWKAHDPSNELMIFHGLNRAKNYDDYAEAIKYLTCPGQNPVFGAKDGDIAIWQQGDFPAKWRRQGDFIMPGFDSSYMWKGIIPQQENPHMRNPERGYVSSANQLSVDSTYPYYTGNSFPVYRGYIINRMLDSMTGITVDDMKQMQTDNYNVKAEFARDILLSVDKGRLGARERKYFDIFQQWNLRNDNEEKGATVFYVWWKELEHEIWGDELERPELPLPWPNEATLLESLKEDSVYKFVDNINTEVVESLGDVLVSSLKSAAGELAEAEGEDRLEWAKYKSTKVQHLLKLPALSSLNLPIGGGAGIINATKADHGPSWRMIIHLTDDTEAWGVYPGGQSGNAGSKYYDNFIDSWAKGDYYRLWMMKSSEGSDQRVKWRMKFSKRS